MRPPIAAGAIAGFVVLSVLVYVAGHSLVEPSIIIDAEDMPADYALSDDAEGNEADLSHLDHTGATSDQSDAGNSIDPSGYERIEPRAPLSELSLALPPPPKDPSEWEGTILHRAIAPSAGVIEAMGYHVTIDGVEPVAADTRCTYKGEEWQCGMRARTAFRGFLRGRSPTCKVPDEPPSEMISAKCHIGKKDLGEWLVSNGWARAVPAGPYAEASAKAEQVGRGIFGAPPGKGGLPELPESYPPLTATVRETPSIEILVPDASQSPSFAGATPPVPQPEPAQ
ncbi:MAG: thermonuclease family protein [Rhizobiaceae bacterium]